MCRIAAYVGPPIRLASLLTEPEHGLVDQSVSPREMRSGNHCLDGWGVGWFAPELGPGPGLLKGALPIGSDPNAKGSAQAIASGSIVAMVRFASPGVAVNWANSPLFAVDDHLITHNGSVKPWPDPLARVFRRRLDPADEAALQGTGDSEILAALWRTERRRAPGHDPAEALRAALAVARDEAKGHGGSIEANVIVGGASGFLAARFADPGPPASLYYLERGARWPDGILVASEPLDGDEGWREVPPSTLIRADRDGARLEPLP